MKQFLKFLFASILGVFISLFLIFILFATIIGTVISSSTKEKKVDISENSILHLELNKQIKDKAGNNPFENFDFSTFEDRTPISLRSLLENINKAKLDDNIKGIYLNISNLNTSLSSIIEIRNALKDFKSSGKFIISYAEDYGQSVYFLSSIANEVYLNPSGSVSYKGLSATLMFFKDALERLDIDMQVIRHGKFKSAVEPYLRNDMSEENRLQYEELINGIWDNQSKVIAESRNIPIEKLKHIADSLLIRTADDALKYGFVDALLYEDQVTERLKELSEISSDKKIKLVALNKYNKVKLPMTVASKSREKWDAKDEIAVIYAEGEIVSGKGTHNNIGSTSLVDAIKKAKESSKVKAILLRVNSPGGSALASDIIWREVVLAKKEKPVIVSMGGLAASGGYYISCAADKIYAESSTLTGSIGVFGVIPNFGNFLSHKIGVNTDQVVTNTNADGLTLSRPLNSIEKEMIQESIEHIYDDFTKKVAEGRGMSQNDVNEIGEGRVWNGISAKRIGLVDEIGGIEDAITAAADLAELDSYKIRVFPKAKSPWEDLILNLEMDIKSKLYISPFGRAERYYENIKRVTESSGIYTRMPVDIIIE